MKLKSYNFKFKPVYKTIFKGNIIMTKNFCLKKILKV